MDTDSVQSKLYRRFTTIEGWREVGHGVYVAAGSTISAIAFDRNPEHGPEWPVYDDDSSQTTRMSKPDRQRLALMRLEGQGSVHPWGESRSLYANEPAVPETALQNPFMPPQNPFMAPEELEQAQASEQRDNVGAGGIFVPAPDPSAPTEKPAPAEKPFHIFDKKKKWTVVITIGMAGLFSGLSSNIYFPSLDAIAKDLNVSLGAVSLTITSYLIIQGISPLFWGPLSDILGRRVIYIASFSTYIVANIGLSFSPNFAALLIFRGLQSAGSASTVSIGNGVIQDIATPLERGAFISFYQAIRNFSIAVGPVLGGLLANFFGFRSIFIFLTILSSLVIITIIVFLPETLRAIAGNGTLRLTGIHRPLIYYLKEPKYMEDPEGEVRTKKVNAMTFIEPLKMLAEKDISVTLIFGGMIYTVWSMVVASTTGLFKDRFGLNELTLGLAFLPNGFGTIVGSSIAGKLMTRDFLLFERRYLEIYPDAPPPSKTRKSLSPDFQIERARLRHIPWMTALFVVCTGLFGFTVLPAGQFAPVAVASSPGWIAVPLLLQFFIAATSNAVFAINTTLVSDLYPGSGAGSTAVNNLVRCSMAAVGVALVDAMVALMGAATAFLALAEIVVVMTALLVVEWYWGQKWRGQREKRKEERLNAAKGLEG